MRLWSSLKCLLCCRSSRILRFVRVLNILNTRANASVPKSFTSASKIHFLPVFKRSSAFLGARNNGHGGEAAIFGAILHPLCESVSLPDNMEGENGNLCISIKK